MTEFTNRDVAQIFPTTIFHSMTMDDEFIQRIEDAVYKMQEEGYGDSFGGAKGIKFSSHDDLFNKEEFKELAELILKETEEMLHYNGVKFEKHYLSALWCNITSAYHMHPTHTHPNSILSGVFYVKAPEGCSKLELVDPRPGAVVFQPEYYRSTSDNSHVVQIEPTRGGLIVFPSWLAHTVNGTFNEKDEIRDHDRIAIAFNINVVTTVTRSTMKLRMVDLEENKNNSENT